MKLYRKFTKDGEFICYTSQYDDNYDMAEIKDMRDTTFGNDEEFKVVVFMDASTGEIKNITAYQTYVYGKRPINCVAFKRDNDNMFEVYVGFRKDLCNNLYDIVTTAKTIAMDEWFCDKWRWK